jgi:hypothetical protein
MNLDEAIRLLTKFGSDQDPIKFRRKPCEVRDLLDKMPADINTQNIYIHYRSAGGEVRSGGTLSGMVKDRVKTEVNRLL